MADHAFPLTRDNWSFDALWAHCWALFRREWATLSGAVIVVLAASVAASFLTQGLSLAFGAKGGPAGVVLGAILGQVVYAAVQGIFTMGMIRIALDVLDGRKADLSRIFSQASKLGRYLLQVLLVNAVLLAFVAAVFALVCGVALAAGLVAFDDLRADPAALVPYVVLTGLLVLWPALYYGLPMAFATMELVHDDAAGPVEAIRRAYVLARGQRLAMLGTLLVFGLVAIAGALACCIGIVPAIAFGHLLIVGLYLALRAGSGLPPLAHGA